MNVLIVYAHNGGSSFNAALKDTAVTTLTMAGHSVNVSDLYAMNFDPVSDRRNFSSIKNADIFNQQDEETYAYEQQTFSQELKLEMDKLQQCDLLIFQFPIWWLGMPAILKGWVDRVFARGVAYGGGHFFDQGKFAGKRAMLSITMGGPQLAYSEQGIYCRSIEDILFPIHHGILNFTGFSVLQPFVVYEPNHIEHIERQACLEQYQQSLLNLDTKPILANIKTEDYQGYVSK